MSDVPQYYVLRNRVPFAVDMRTWAEEFADINKRRVAQTDITDSIDVSTVFLGLDHAYRILDDNEEPVLFETMVFGGPLDGETRRYCTYDQAERGHEEVVAEVRSAL